MKRIVAYDSQFGNTKKIAEAIGEELGKSSRIFVMHISDVQVGDLLGLSTIIVGSPTQRMSATAPVKRWLNNLPKGILKGVRAAAFDTRYTQEKIDQIKTLGFFVRIFGYGAMSIAQRLEKKGANLIVPPQGFYVDDIEGPLLDQELKRAAEWANKIISI